MIARERDVELGIRRQGAWTRFPGGIGMELGDQVGSIGKIVCRLPGAFGGGITLPTYFIKEFAVSAEMAMYRNKSGSGPDRITSRIRSGLLRTGMSRRPR